MYFLGFAQKGLRKEWRTAHTQQAKSVYTCIFSFKGLFFSVLYSDMSFLSLKMT
jgi:hypothetical protein